VSSEPRIAVLTSIASAKAQLRSSGLLSCCQLVWWTRLAHVYVAQADLNMAVPVPPSLPSSIDLSHHLTTVARSNTCPSLE
jgi:hypothetical protein